MHCGVAGGRKCSRYLKKTLVEYKKNKKNIPGARDASASRAPVIVVSAFVWLPLVIVVHIP